MNAEKKRYTDYPGEPRPDYEERNGIEDRLRLAKPGTSIQLRPDTQDLRYNSVQEITWRQILNILEAQGVLKDCGDNLFQKKTPNFGKEQDNGEDREIKTLSNALDEAIENKYQAMGPETLDGQRKILSATLRASMRNSECVFDLPDFTPLIDILIDSFLEGGPDHAKKLTTDDSFFYEIYKKFSQIFRSQLNTSTYPYRTVTFNGSNINVNITTMLENWTRQLRHQLSRLPDIEKA